MSARPTSYHPTLIITNAAIAATQLLLMLSCAPDTQSTALLTQAVCITIFHETENIASSKIPKNCVVSPRWIANSNNTASHAQAPSHPTSGACPPCTHEGVRVSVGRRPCTDKTAQQQHHRVPYVNRRR